MLRTFTLALLLSLAACGNSERDPLTAQEAAFEESVAPCCGPIVAETRLCDVFLVSEHQISHMTGFSGRSALLTYRSRHGYVRGEWYLIEWFDDFSLEPYRLVGPGDQEYEATRQRYFDTTQ